MYEVPAEASVWIDQNPYENSISADDERAAALVVFMAFLRARVSSTQNGPIGYLNRENDPHPIDWHDRRAALHRWTVEPSQTYTVDEFGCANGNRTLFGVRLSNISRLACSSVVMIGSGAFGVVHPRVSAELNVLRGWCIHELMLCGFEIPYTSDNETIEDEARIQAGLLDADAV